MNGRVWRSRQQQNGIEPNSFHNMTCNDHGILRPRIPKLVIRILKKSLVKIVGVLASSIWQYIISCRTDKMKSFLIKTRPTSISSKTASNFIGRFDYDKWLATIVHIVFFHVVLFVYCDNAWQGHACVVIVFFPNWEVSDKYINCFLLLQRND